jgi:flavin reductase (DIM6/NTAB) family NADH-FMN oxidoreductase RutF
MEFDLTALGESTRYRLLTGLVVPRPIAWITTLNENGTVNLAPYSFFNVLGNAPPLVAFGPSPKNGGGPKDTRRNIETEREFVVNLADRRIAEMVQKSAAALPYGTSEVEALGLTLTPSKKVRTPRLVESPVQLECRYWGTVLVEANEVVFGVVEYIHAPDDWFEADGLSLRPGSVQTIGRMQGPGRYCTTTDQFDLGRMPSADALLRETGEPSPR